ncbi:MAG: HD domain-containing protein [Chromatiales bacterium]|nr:HD domain-containing protein [Chromatiales bacterium]
MTDRGSLFSHQDTLAQLNDNSSLTDKLKIIHQTLRLRLDFIERVAVAVYDAKSDVLRTFIHSSGDAQPLTNYQASLSSATSLHEIIEVGRPRVVNDLSIFNDSEKTHSKQIRAEGYGASYTMPMYRQGEFFGFIFFNASRSGVFNEENLHYLDLFGHLLSLSVIDELYQYNTLQAAIDTARDITHHRDNETGTHLDRMSRFARLIARELAPKHNFSDEFVEQIFRFAPLHDIGKIAIPDSILLKKAQLDEHEFTVMKSHTLKGVEIIDEMLDHFGLNGLDHSEVLRNIAEYHHEKMNGMGYPRGLTGEEIPIEARIIAVADIFDALTSRRPYKEAWSNEDAYALLREMAGKQLDPDCVSVFLQQQGEIEEIQRIFHENTLG